MAVWVQGRCVLRGELMSRERVLVVDDEEDILELVEYNLAKEGCRVTCVATGEEALDEVRRRPPDLVVLDLMLPGVDGLEVCRLLKRDPRTAEVPVVMLTAKGEEADVVRGLELGADDYVTKPFSPRVLTARVKAVLRRKAKGPLGEQAVVNLVDNAVNHSEAGSRVAVAAVRSGDEVLIRVRDEGCGIASEDLPRLFERFYRVDKARSRKLGGTGLGLAIVKHIVQGHRGRVTVDSTPGKGSTFAIHLPAR